MDFTPTTEEVRNALIRSAPRDEWELRGTQFDRWLAEVKAQAWEEGVRAGENNLRVRQNPGTITTYELNPYRQEEKE